MSDCETDARVLLLVEMVEMGEGGMPICEGAFCGIQPALAWGMIFEFLNRWWGSVDETVGRGSGT